MERQPPESPPPADRGQTQRPQSQQAQSQQAQSQQAWARTTLWVLVVTMLLAAGLYVFRSLRNLPGDAVDKTAEWIGELASVASAFAEGTVEDQFSSYRSAVSASSFFQFATLSQTEVFTRTDRASVLWGHLELPEVVVSATAPIEYSYYVDFDECWSFERSGSRVQVLAPVIRHNRPAIDVSKLYWDVRASSALRDETAAIEALRSALTPLAEARAKEHVDLIREVGRNRIEEFVAQWLMNEFGDGGDYAVEVRFADEGELRSTPLQPSRLQANPG